MYWDSKTTVTTFHAYQIKKIESYYNVDELSGDMFINWLKKYVTQLTYSLDKACEEFSGMTRR